jgi:hypothetical protein
VNTIAATIKVGISACAFGRKVRFDGQAKEERYLSGTLAQFVEFVRPEVELTWKRCSRSSSDRADCGYFCGYKLRAETHVSVRLGPA